MANLSVNDADRVLFTLLGHTDFFCAFAVNVGTISLEKREHVDLVDTPMHLILVHHY